MTTVTHSDRQLSLGLCAVGSPAADVQINLRQLVDRGALFVGNHSGGKDSQAMAIKLKRLVPADQLIFIHSHLEGVEWEGTLDHIKNTIGDSPLIVTVAIDNDGKTKTLEGMVRQRGMFPSPKNRQCTSDLKRGPIERELRRYLKQNPQYGGLLVNCMGLRAQESSGRASKQPLTLNRRNSKAGREWYDWLPIQDMLVGDVFRTIEAAEQEPHWAYSVGASRLSCALCIMASRRDLAISALYNPKVYDRWTALEREFDTTMLMPAKGQPRPFLDEIVPAEIAKMREQAA